jgi:hypothetical protein
MILFNNIILLACKVFFWSAARFFLISRVQMLEAEVEDLRATVMRLQQR